tara:strand:+ start:1640 stop:1948 length:309 start_codon:yes stop_codon:yes gene_type:complete
MKHRIKNDNLTIEYEEGHLSITCNGTWHGGVGDFCSIIAALGEAFDPGFPALLYGYPEDDREECLVDQEAHTAKLSTGGLILHENVGGKISSGHYYMIAGAN